MNKYNIFFFFLFFFFFIYYIYNDKIASERTNYVPTEYVSKHLSQKKKPWT